jgi:hypothetical protein
MKASALLLFAGTAVSSAWPIYQLHEWGTFTTVSGSDGTLLTGLEREEEPLPAFVHAHFGLENGKISNIDRYLAEFSRIQRLHGTAGFNLTGFKGMGWRPVAAVTVKMETPVIYFHSEEVQPFALKVNVGFEGGTISQWYPERSGGETLPEPPAPADPIANPTPLAAWTVDFSKPYRGEIEWKLDVLPPAATKELPLFKPADSVGWLRARQPVTNAIRTSSGETEGYLFYRGIGNFQPGLKTTIDSAETLHLTNQTGGKIPYALVFDRTGGTVRWAEFKEGFASEGQLAVAESDLKTEPTGFSMPIYQAMRQGLAGCGLTDGEARAMVETWWNSYFEAPGLRVFWVVPTQTTDQILPLKVSPPPTRTVRVIVGRSEVLRPRQEAEWLAASRQTGDNAAGWKYLVTADRFGLAIQQRVEAIETQNETAATAN